jgi:hypothetical protein
MPDRQGVLNVSHIQDAIGALLKVWPRGQDCEHAHAREAFQALVRAKDHEAELVDALESMCHQYLRTEDGKLHHDFMSAGEAAFDALGWDDAGHPVDASCLCEVPGCGNRWSSGMFGKDGVYHTTCCDHWKTVEPETEEQSEARWLADMRKAGCTEDMIAEAVANRKALVQRAEMLQTATPPPPAPWAGPKTDQTQPTAPTTTDPA